ncbi:MAG TPA: DUF309 domain-containing protein [Campylobacterales bacterium]|nr:DUF309 domain-containing protein [Campylobacterales bacterium]
MIVYEIKMALINFIHHIEKELYFEAHEILEEIWHKAKKKNHPQTLLIKGLINASISFAHIKRGRKTALKSSKTTIKSYYRYKDMCTPSIENFDIFHTACSTIDRHRYITLIDGDKEQTTLLL